MVERERERFCVGWGGLGMRDWKFGGGWATEDQGSSSSSSNNHSMLEQGDKYATVESLVTDESKSTTWGGWFASKFMNPTSLLPVQTCLTSLLPR